MKKATKELWKMMDAFEGRHEIKDRKDIDPEKIGWHVCCTQPTMGCPNFESVCAKCKCVVWYGNNTLPTVKKICPSCAEKLAGDPDCISVCCTEDILTAKLFHKRN